MDFMSEAVDEEAADGVEADGGRSLAEGACNGGVPCESCGRFQGGGFERTDRDFRESRDVGFCCSTFTSQTTTRFRP